MSGDCNRNVEFARDFFSVFTFANRRPCLVGNYLRCAALYSCFQRAFDDTQLCRLVRAGHRFARLAAAAAAVDAPRDASERRRR